MLNPNKKRDSESFITFMLPKQSTQPTKLLKPLFVQKKAKQSFFTKLDYTFVKSRQSFDQTSYQDWTRKIFFFVSNTDETKNISYFVILLCGSLFGIVSFTERELSKRRDSFINKTDQAKYNFWEQLSLLFIKTSTTLYHANELI